MRADLPDECNGELEARFAGNLTCLKRAKAIHCTHSLCENEERIWSATGGII